MKTAIGLAATLLLMQTHSLNAATFEGLSDLSGGTFGSWAFGVSADGSTVVGQSNSFWGTEAFSWTAETGMVSLGFLPGDTTSWADAVSADGSVAVGASGPNSYTGNDAVRFISGGGKVKLGYLPGDNFNSASGTNPDGSVMVGASGKIVKVINFPLPPIHAVVRSSAVRWTADGGILYLGDLSGGNVNAKAYGVSADGSTVVGFGTTSSGTEAFRWTDGGGMVGLDDLPGGPRGSMAYGVSGDGSVVVGWGTGTAGQEAFRWSADTETMVGLGVLPGDSKSLAEGVSADGSVVWGRSESASGEYHAFIWDEANAMRNLQDVLTNDYGLGLDLTDWSLSITEGISDDGLVIIGYGINPSGNTEAWRAVIPEPSTLVLLAIAAVGLLAYARRRRG